MRHPVCGNITFIFRGVFSGIEFQENRNWHGFRLLHIRKNAPGFSINKMLNEEG